MQKIIYELYNLKFTYIADISYFYKKSAILIYFANDATYLKFQETVLIFFTHLQKFADIFIIFPLHQINTYYFNLKFTLQNFYFPFKI